jgi:hypothetical protein
MADAESAAAFAAIVQRLLPGELAGPSESRAIGDRAVVVSRGLATAGAVAWADALESRRMDRFGGVD